MKIGNRIFIFSVEDTDLNLSNAESVESNDPSNAKRIGNALVGHEQESLRELLEDILLSVETSTDIETSENLNKSFEKVENIVSETNKFIEQATLIEANSFIGFTHSLYEDARTNITNAVTLVGKFRERNLLSFVSKAKELVMELNQVKIIESSTTLEQMKKALETREQEKILRYRIKPFS